MSTRFVVMDSGLTTSIYKIPSNQTARLKNEYGNEGLELFDELEDAKQAALQIIARHDEASRQDHRRFTFKADPQIADLKSQLSDLTEDRIETFFL